MSEEMSLEEATSPYSKYETNTPMSEGYLTRKWMRLCVELSRRPVTEAAPGGLSEMDLAVLETAEREDKFRDDHIAGDLARIVRRLLTPAPNREAELKDALREIANGSCCGEFVNGCPVNNYGGDNTASCARTKVKRILAQAEMKGEE